MKKELRPVHESVACDVCGRTILKGEQTETYLSPDGRSHQVCDLCFARAEHHGWVRESVAGDTPHLYPRPEPRRSLLGRLRKRREQPAGERAEEPQADFAEHEATYAENGVEAAPEPVEAALEPEPEPDPEPPPRQRPRPRPKDPRHVRAVPTTGEGKVERAFELFNGSEHQRTVAGLARTLGPAWVTAVPDAGQPSSVTVLVAWELSWYRFKVDLAVDSDRGGIAGER